MPNKLEGLRRTTMAEAETIVEEIPVALERLELCEKLIYETRNRDSAAAKRQLVKAMHMIWAIASSSAKGTERRLLDVAYRLDPEFASGLQNSMDTDEARKSHRRLHARENRIQDLKKSLDLGNVPARLNDGVRAEIADAAWRQLRALNSDRVNPVRFTDALRWLPVTAEMSMAEAFPIFSWIIENVVRGRDVSEKGRAHVKNLFSATIATARLARRISEQAAKDFNRGSYSLAETSAAGLVKAVAGRIR